MSHTWASWAAQEKLRVKLFDPQSHCPSLAVLFLWHPLDLLLKLMVEITLVGELRNSVGHWFLSAWLQTSGIWVSSASSGSDVPTVKLFPNEGLECKELPWPSLPSWDPLLPLQDPWPPSAAQRNRTLHNLTFTWQGYVLRGSQTQFEQTGRVKFMCLVWQHSPKSIPTPSNPPASPLCSASSKANWIKATPKLLLKTQKQKVEKQQFSLWWLVAIISPYT